jgi:hypothetical protein
MGLSVSVDNEDCTILELVNDPTNILHRILPDSADATYLHLNVIDWYGNTTFNYLQMPRFLSELERLEISFPSGDERVLLASIRRLAERVRDDRHIYLMFRGD